MDVARAPARELVVRLRWPRVAGAGRAWRSWRARVASAGARAGRRVATPTAQLLAAAGGALLGGALIGRWCVGLMLIAAAAAVAADALLRESGSVTGRAAATSHEDVLDRWRRAR